MFSGRFSGFDMSFSSAGVAALLAATALLSISCLPASAATITGTFSGAVRHTHASLPFQVGDAVNGAFTYDSGAVASPTNYPFTNPTPMGTSNYLGQILTLTVAGYTYTAPYSNIGVGDDGTPLIVNDFLSVSGPAAGSSFGDYVPGLISLLFYDANDTAFTSNALPPPPMLDQADFTAINGEISFHSTVAPFDRIPLTYDVYTFALPAAPVPEPSTYVLLLAGLGFVGFVARRRKTRQSAA